MSSNLKNIYQYIQSDYCRYEVKANLSSILLTLLIPRNHCLRYLTWLRLSSQKNPFQLLAILMHKRYTVKYGIDIPRATSIGYGLYIGHGIGLVINPTAVIGNNCNLSQFTTIGSNHNQAAVIGNNVGNEVTIGAGAVVVKDIPDNATAVGVPAKVVSYSNPGRYINSKW